jgi:hypothetical protein
MQSLLSRIPAWGLTEDLQGRRWLVGLVPDSNQVVELELELRDGATKTVGTVEGVVVIRELDRLLAVRFRDAVGGLQRQQA